MHRRDKYSQKKYKKNKEHLWTLLMNATRMNAVMACSSHLSTASFKGIVPSHAYSVHSVYEVVTHKV